MTVKTETEKPVLTYSKSKGLMALLTGMESQLDISVAWMETYLIFSLFFCLNLKLFFFLLCCSFYETKEDGAERLHSEACNQLLRLQAVSSI